jgi:hypothetical protein
MKLSDCCAAEIIWHDICSDCRDHCGELEDDDEYNVPIIQTTMIDDSMIEEDEDEEE